MSTVADALNVMKILNNELEVFEGGRQEARCITSLIQAQHYFELLCATYPSVLQDVITVTTAANTETTAKPASLRRLDAVWYLDVDGRPIYKAESIQEVGGHAPNLPWPVQIIASSELTGKPFAYYATAADFYWMARPDGTHTFRIYGFLKKDAFVDRDSTFEYYDDLLLPFAIFANKLMKMGVEDETIDLDKLTGQVFTPTLRQLRKVDRSTPTARHYTDFHIT